MPVARRWARPGGRVARAPAAARSRTPSAPRPHAVRCASIRSGTASSSVTSGRTPARTGPGEVHRSRGRGEQLDRLAQVVEPVAAAQLPQQGETQAEEAGGAPPTQQRHLLLGHRDRLRVRPRPCSAAALMLLHGFQAGLAMVIPSGAASSAASASSQRPSATSRRASACWKTSRPRRTAGRRLRPRPGVPQRRPRGRVAADLEPPGERLTDPAPPHMRSCSSASSAGRAPRAARPAATARTPPTGWSDSVANSDPRACPDGAGTAPEVPDVVVGQHPDRGRSTQNSPSSTPISRSSVERETCHRRWLAPGRSPSSSASRATVAASIRAPTPSPLGSGCRRPPALVEGVHEPADALERDQRLALVGAAPRGAPPRPSRANAVATPGGLANTVGRRGRDRDLGADARVLVQAVGLHQVLDARRAVQRRFEHAELQQHLRPRRPGRATRPVPGAGRSPRSPTHRARPPSGTPSAAAPPRPRHRGAAPAAGVPRPARRFPRGPEDRGRPLVTQAPLGCRQRL